MFGLETLDIVIGMIFVFLMLSLVCTAVNEIIEAWLNKRADYLQQGISELVSRPGEEINLGMVQRIYDHPLISGLFRGTYNKDGSFLPSYIPSENFAMALIDVFLNSSNSSSSATPPPPGSAPPNVKSSSDKTSPPAAAFSLASLRAAVDANINHPELGTAAKALRALMATPGDDADKAKKNIENWFNNSMDRVSGWYKRRTQIITLLLGLGVAVGANADSIAICNRLSYDKALRDSTVAAAQEYVKKDASGTKPDASPSVSPGVTPSVSPSVSPSPKATASPSVSPETKSSPATETNAPLSCKKDPESPKCKFDTQTENLKNMGLPIGWSLSDENLFPPKENQVGPWLLRLFGNWLLKTLGLFITAFAISLGSPFWFDLLNKFMVVRSTVKPKEKSPDEASKD